MAKSPLQLSKIVHFSFLFERFLNILWHSGAPPPDTLRGDPLTSPPYVDLASPEISHSLAQEAFRIIK